MKRKVWSGLVGFTLGLAALISCAPKSKVYTVTFTNGNELVSQKEYEEGQYILPPDDLPSYTKDAYVYDFTGWYDGEVKFEKGIKVTQDVEYNARFTQGRVCEYKVTFYLDDDELTTYAICDALHGDPVGEIKPTVDPAGYTEDDVDYVFDYWKDENGDRLDEETIVTSDLKYYAVFKEGGSRGSLLTYYDHDETTVLGSFIGHDEEVITKSLVPMNPPSYTEGGLDYSFDHWTNKKTSEPLVIGETTIAGSMDFIATYNPGVPHEYTVTVNFEDGYKGIVKYTESNWSEKRLNILKLLPTSTADTSYALDKYVPINCPKSDLTYNVVATSTDFDLDFATQTSVDKRFLFVNRTAGSTGFSFDEANHELNLNMQNDNAYLSSSLGSPLVAKDLDFRFTVKSSTNGAESITVLFGLNNDNLQVGYGGRDSANFKDGVLGVAIVPNTDNPVHILKDKDKVSYAPAGRYYWNYYKSPISNDTDVEIIIKDYKITVFVNSILVVENIDVSDYYTGGYVGFARGTVANIDYSFTHSMSLKARDVNEYFDYNFNDNLVGNRLFISHRTTQAATPASLTAADGKLNMVSGTGNNENIVTYYKYKDFVLDARLKVLDSGYKKPAFFITSDISKISNNWSENSSSYVTSSANRDAAAVLDPSHASGSVSPAYNGVALAAQKLGPTIASFTDEYITLRVVSNNNHITIWFNGGLYADFPLSSEFVGGYVGITSNKTASFDSFSIKPIDDNFDEKSFDYDYTSKTSIEGDKLYLKNNSGNATATINTSDKQLDFAGINNDNFASAYDYKGLEAQFSYKVTSNPEANPGRLTLALGVSDLTKSYANGANMGTGLLGIMLVCNGSNNNVRTWDNSATPTDNALAASFDSTSDFIDVLIHLEYKKADSKYHLTITITSGASSATPVNDKALDVSPNGHFVITKGGASAAASFSFKKLSITALE